MNLYYWSGEYEGIVVMADSEREAREKATPQAVGTTIKLDVKPHILKSGVFYWG